MNRPKRQRKRNSLSFSELQEAEAAERFLQKKKNKLAKLAKLASAKLISSNTKTNSSNINSKVQQKHTLRRKIAATVKKNFFTKSNPRKRPRTYKSKSSSESESSDELSNESFDKSADKLSDESSGESSDESSGESSGELSGESSGESSCESSCESSSSSVSSSTISSSRKSTRKRKSRYISIDGHQILKQNLYGLGEAQTITGSIENVQLRNLPKIKAARNSFTLYCAKFREKRHGNDGNSGGSIITGIKEASKSWNLLNDSEKLVYFNLAIKDKIRYNKEMEKRSLLIKKLKKKNKSIMKNEKKNERKNEKKNGKKKDFKKVKKRRSNKPSEKQRILREYNAMVKEESRKRSLLRTIYLSQNRNALLPFIESVTLLKNGITTTATAESIQLTTIKTTPSYIVRGQLRPYQLKGVSWLINMHERGTNCILADEMGLGKTLQTITFLSYIKFHLKINGPSLVVVPLSVLTSWKNEFKKWAPTLNVIQLHSSGKKLTKLSGGIFLNTIQVT